MLVFSPCKINLGLSVTGKRADGYHNIDSVFYPVAIRDCIEVIEKTPLPNGQCKFIYREIHMDGHKGENLCEKAYALLNSEFNLPGTEIYLQKNIPTGAGL